MPTGTLVLDNRDSFTWNLVHLLESLGDRPRVVRPFSDADPEGLKPEELQRILDHEPPPRLLISPGPGGPDEAALSLLAVRLGAGRLPILGVCLGHQVLARHHGLGVRRGPPVHGRTARITHDGRGLFAGIPDGFLAARYHSLAVDRPGADGDLQPSAFTVDADGTRILMGLRHRRLPVESVQFHPESFLTEHGSTMLRNFLAWT